MHTGRHGSNDALSIFSSVAPSSAQLLPELQRAGGSRTSPKSGASKRSEPPPDTRSWGPTNIRQIGHPELVRRGDVQIRRKIWINRQTAVDFGFGDEPLFRAAHQVFFAHQVQHALVVDANALPLQLVHDAVIAIVRSVQSHLSLLRAQRSSISAVSG